jgi:hypothetical protein
MMKHLTQAQAEEMRATIRQRSDSYIDFALKVAEHIGDTIAIELYTAEMDRRLSAEILAMVPVLGPIPTWKDL